jgi:hypothetical protein
MLPIFRCHFAFISFSLIFSPFLPTFFAVSITPAFFFQVFASRFAAAAIIAIIIITPPLFSLFH